MQQTITLSYADIRRHDPDILLPPDLEFSQEYASRAANGIWQAKIRKVAFVAICRNAMPFLPLTLSRIEHVGNRFAEWSCYVYENDSIDGTKDCLSDWSDGKQRFCDLSNLGRPHLNNTIEPVRTVALAEYRNKCRAWVESQATEYDYVVVFDTDPWGGFSVRGLLNTIGHLETREYGAASGMAAYSWCEFSPEVPSHYDAFACRWTGWKRRVDMRWFHMWHPPVGSPPVRMNSAFGQMAVYRASHYLAGEYAGHDDCEHVSFHRSLPGTLYLNPSMRCVSFWSPGMEPANGIEEEGRDLHSDVRSDVVGRDADPSDIADAEDLG